LPPEPGLQAHPTPEQIGVLLDKCTWRHTDEPTMYDDELPFAIMGSAALGGAVFGLYAVAIVVIAVIVGALLTVRYRAKR
jgi:hypothetical protein